MAPDEAASRLSPASASAALNRREMSATASARPAVQRMAMQGRPRARSSRISASPWAAWQAAKGSGWPSSPGG